MANTTNFAIETPTVGGYRNTWGGTINTGLSRIDELLALAMPIGTIQMYPKTTAPTATANGGTWLVCDGSTLTRSDYPDLHTLITNTYGAYPSGTTFVLPDMRTRVPVGYSASTVGSGTTQRTPKAIAVGSGTETHTLVETEIPKHQHPITDNGHIHPIDPSTTHFHVGDQDGGKTSNAVLSITDPKHSHSFTTFTEWSSGDGYGVAFDNGPVHQDITTTSESTGISIADHAHSLTTDAKPTGITTTQTNPARITTTNEPPDGDQAHNIMQPYLVVNYIILAKHPTF